jgi:uncharacterized cupredoxin-like copper-binding protein
MHRIPEFIELCEAQIAYSGIIIPMILYKQCGMGRSAATSYQFQEFIKKHNLKKLNKYAYVTPDKLGLFKNRYKDNHIALDKQGRPVGEIKTYLMEMKEEFTLTDVKNMIFGGTSQVADRIIKTMGRKGLLKVIYPREQYPNVKWHNYYFYIVANQADLIGGFSVRNNGTKMDEFRKVMLSFKKADKTFTHDDLKEKLGNIESMFYVELSRLLRDKFISKDEDTGEFEFIR